MYGLVADLFEHTLVVLLIECGGLDFKGRYGVVPVKVECIDLPEKN